MKACPYLLPSFIDTAASSMKPIKTSSLSEISFINNDHATLQIRSPIEFLAGGQNAAFLTENFKARNTL